MAEEMNTLRRSQLAIDGGSPPVRSEPVAPWPVYAHDEVDAVARVLRSGRVNYWTGEEGRRFESEFADYTNCKHAVAVANGTVALELALYSLGIGSGDEVIVPSRTFIASASCVVMRGAIPVVADVDAVSQNITADTIAAVITPRTRAVIVVHLAGWPCDMEPILELAKRHGLKVIEDCAQATGATYKGRKVGSLGDAAAFSFCQDKIVTTGGEGGMFTTNMHDVWYRAWAYKDHGKDYNTIYNRENATGFRWVHESFGTNWRMTEIQAAIGRIQLVKLPRWLEKRRRYAGMMMKGLTGIDGLRLTDVDAEPGHVFYKYYAFIRPERLRPEWDRLRIQAAIEAEGVPCHYGSCSEIYREKAFMKADFISRERLPVARVLGDTSLMFPVHPTLQEEDLTDACTAVHKVMQGAVGAGV